MCMVFSEKSMPENTEDTKSVENVIYLLSLSLGNSYFILKEDALAYFWNAIIAFLRLHYPL